MSFFPFVLLILTLFGRMVVGKTEASAQALAGKWTTERAFVGTPQQLVEQMQPFVEAAEEMVARPTLPYLERSKELMSARLVYLPQAEEVPVICEIPLVIEYYSR